MSATLLPRLSALADGTRWDILTILGSTELSASALADRLPVSRQAIAKHLAILADAGLVESVRSGRELRYRALGSRLGEVADELLAVGAEWDARLARIKAIAERREPALVQRPAPTGAPPPSVSPRPVPRGER